MEIIDNPKYFFAKMDAGDVDGGCEVMTGEDSSLSIMESVKTTTVEFVDHSDPADDFHDSLKKVQEAATTAETLESVSDEVDTKFETEEDGTPVSYLGQAGKIGYEVVQREANPRLSGYIVTNEENLYRVEEPA